MHCQRKKGFLYAQVNRPLSGLCVTRTKEIGVEDRKWLLKRFSGSHRQASVVGPVVYCWPPSDLTEPWGIRRCVYLAQQAHYTRNRNRT